MSGATQKIIAAPERAFRRSEEYRFKGKKLEPFSHLRQTAAVALGLRYWYLSQDDFKTIKNGEKKKLIDGTKLSKDERKRIDSEPDEILIYGGIYHDVAIIMWLCHQNDSTCRRARRESEGGGSDQWEAKIDKWADSNGVVFNGPSMTEAVSVFMQIMQDLKDSVAVPEKAETETEDDEDDP